MSTTLRLPRLGLFHLFEDLAAYHPAAHFGAMRTRSVQQYSEEALAFMPAHLREDAGLPPLAPEEPEHPAITKARSRGRNWG